MKPDPSLRPSANADMGGVNTPTPTPGLGLEKLKNLVEALEQLRETAVVIREYQKEMADLMHHRVKCLEKAGFNRQEAIYIITNRPELI